MNNKLTMLMFLGLLILGIIFTSGCVQENNLSGSTENPTIQPTTVTPAQGNEEYCVSNETGTTMSFSEASEIALNSECGTQGTLKDTYFCNEYTGTWWIDLEPLNEKPGCNPACVVNVSTKTAEINWRCTGAIPPDS
jgi:hypothetical protein